MLSPQLLQGVGLVMEGQWGSLSLRCAPQAGRLCFTQPPWSGTIPAPGLLESRTRAAGMGTHSCTQLCGTSAGTRCTCPLL